MSRMTDLRTRTPAPLQEVPKQEPETMNHASQMKDFHGSGVSRRWSFVVRRSGLKGNAIFQLAHGLDLTTET